MAKHIRRGPFDDAANNTTANNDAPASSSCVACRLSS